MAGSDSSVTQPDCPLSDESLACYVCVCQMDCEDGDIQLIATSRNGKAFQNLKAITNFFSSMKDVASLLSDILPAVYSTLNHKDSEVDSPNLSNDNEKKDEMVQNSHSDVSFDEAIKMEELSIVKKCRKRYKTRNSDLTSCDVPAITQLTNTPYKCYICKETFSQRRPIHLHRMDKHADVPLNNRLFQCNICKKTFADAAILHQHLFIHAPEKLYRCNGHCDKTFTTKYLMETHERTYIHNDRPFLCGVCGKAWSTKAGLKGHAVMHTQDRVHQCTECGKAYARKSDLTQHLFTHKERQFPCPKCGAMFMRRNDIRKHLLVHETSRSRPFVCCICAKAFHKKSVMETHKAKHSQTHNVVVTDVG